MSEVVITASGSSAEWRERLARYVVVTWWVALAFLTLGLLLDTSSVRLGWDDTDSQTKRSGFTLLTDYGTGCQYLGRIGAVIPRVDASGKHMGCRP